MMIMQTRVFMSAVAGALFLMAFSGLAFADSGMNIEPTEPSKAAEGFNEMSRDLAVLSSGMAPVLAFAAFMIGAVMIILGLVFSKRMAKGGFFLAVAAGFVFFLLSDLNTAVGMVKAFFEKIASYFR